MPDIPAGGGSIRTGAGKKAIRCLYDLLFYYYLFSRCTCARSWARGTSSGGIGVGGRAIPPLPTPPTEARYNATNTTTETFTPALLCSRKICPPPLPTLRNGGIGGWIPGIPLQESRPLGEEEEGEEGPRSDLGAHNFHNAFQSLQINPQ